MTTSYTLRIFVLSFFFHFLNFQGFSQSAHCGNEDFGHLLKTKPAYFETKSVGDSVVKIRTVVHVLGNDLENVTEEEVVELMAGVNELFRAQDVDYDLIHPDHHEKVADTKIQFCLATTDPDGNPHSGVNLYFNEDTTGFAEVDVLSDACVEPVKRSDLGGVDAWPVDQYLNIWLAPMVDSNYPYSYGVPYADHYPAGNLIDCIPGAVVDFTPLEPGIISHELGHVLGLLHTWYIPVGTISDEFFCAGTDYMDDTPVCWPTQDCEEANTCEEDNDEMDNVTNIMNYSCREMFTSDQAATMYNNMITFSQSLIITGEGCGDLISSVDEALSDEVMIRMGPNPTEGILQVDVSKLDIESFDIHVFDKLGAKVYARNFQQQASGSIEVDLVGMKPGIYILILESKYRRPIKKKVVVL